MCVMCVCAKHNEPEMCSRKFLIMKSANARAITQSERERDPCGEARAIWCLALLLLLLSFVTVPSLLYIKSGILMPHWTCVLSKECSRFMCVCVFSFCVFPLDKIVVPLSIVTYTEIRSRARFHHENAIYSHRMLYFPSTISFLHTFSFPIVSSLKLSHAALASLFHTLCQQLLQSTWHFGCGTSDRTDWHQATEFRMHLTMLHSASFRWLHRNDLF